MVSALVYLDAAYDRSGFLSLPKDPFPPAAATSEDVKSYDTLRSYLSRLQGFWSDAQEADMRERLKFTSDGRIYAVTPDFVIDQILRGLPRADYTRITAPTLSIYSLEPLVHPRIPANASEADRKKAQDWWDQIRVANLAQIDQFKQQAPAAKVIEMEDTDHYNFIQRRRFVAREIRDFLSER
jgi:pimeloyl-ACP methyl ester carboxylesterase